MNDADKSSDQLRQELAQLRQQLAAKTAAYQHIKQSLRQSETTVRALLDAPRESVFVIAVDSTILEINEIAAQRYGKRADGLVGTTFWDLMPPELLPSRKAQFQQAIDTRQLVEFEDTRAGMWFENRIFPIIDDQDTVTRLVIVARNITERKHRERALRESEDRYRIISEIVSDYAYSNRIAEDGTIANEWVTDDAFYRITGFHIEEIWPTINQLYHPDDRERLKQDRGRVIAGETVSGEYRIIAKNGEQRWLQLLRRPEWDDQQKRVIRYHGAARDITEQKNAQLERQKLAHVLDERVKELNCLYGITRLVEAPTTTLDEVFQGAVDLIPPSWQFPEITCAQITWDGRQVTSAGFRQSQWMLSSDIIAQGEPIGTVTVYYLEERPAAIEGPFLEEARRLLDAVAELLGHIVERMETEKALQISEERHRAVAEMISDRTFSYRVDPDGSIEIEWYIDAAFLRSVGYSGDELRDNYQLYHPDERERVRRDVEKVITGESTNGEYQIITKDGEPRWLQIDRQPVWDEEQKRVIRFYGAAQDITERKLAEAALQVSEERYRRLSELASDYAYSFIVHADGRFESDWITEDALFQITGYTAEEFSQEVDFYHPEHRPIFDQDLVDLLNGQRIEREYRVITKSGEERWLQTTRHPVWDEDEGRVVRFYGVAKDITERKRIEAELRESEARYRIISEMISDYAYAYRINPEGSLTNEWVTEEALLRVTGYTADEINSFRDLYHPDDRERVRKDGEQVMAGEGGRAEYRIITKGGETRWVQVHRQPIWDPEHKRVVGFHGATRDITEAKRAEQQRLELALERERVQILGSFITQASHEFRTPLTIINTSAHLVQRMDDPAERERQVARIEQQVNHITKLVEDLITLSGLDSTRTLETTEVDLKHVVHAVHDLMQPGHHDKDLNVTMALRKRIPKFQGHFDILRQAIERIWSNAVRNTPSGGTITVRMDRKADTVQITIADTGSGIAPDDLPHIFERFFRTDRVGTTRGFGLGLPIAKAAIELHGGRIEVESEVGAGSTFRIILPIQ